MKNQALKASATVSVLILLAAACVYPQSSLTMVAYTPFHFIIGNMSLAPGEYTIRPITQSALLFQNEYLRARAIVLTFPIQAKKNPNVGTLVFNQYGDQYFLSKVWTPANKTGGKLFKSDVERELASANSGYRTVSITASSETVDVKLQFK
jgi:hypothetical protein